MDEPERTRRSAEANAVDSGGSRAREIAQGECRAEQTALTWVLASEGHAVVARVGISRGAVRIVAHTNRAWAQAIGEIAGELAHRAKYVRQGFQGLHHAAVVRFMDDRGGAMRDEIGIAEVWPVNVEFGEIAR